MKTEGVIAQNINLNLFSWFRKTCITTFTFSREQEVSFCFLSNSCIEPNSDLNHQSVVSRIKQSDLYNKEVSL